MRHGVYNKPTDRINKDLLTCVVLFLVLASCSNKSETVNTERFENTGVVYETNGRDCKEILDTETGHKYVINGYGSMCLIAE